MTKLVLQVKARAANPRLRLRSASWLALIYSAMAACSLLAGNVYYVDPNRGDDTFDGSQPEPAGGDSKVGPRKTLDSVMKLTTANNGDVVYAAPGEYKTEGSGSYRVQITAGTKLIATGLATETFIIGNADSGVEQDASPYGCGPNAVRCVYMAANSSLVGFTVCGGRALGFDENKWGAGIIADNSNNVTVVDCIISNNVAGRSAGLYGGIAVRCELVGNLAYKSGPHAMRASLYNCYCHDALGGDVYPVYQCTIRNCDVRGGVNGCMVFNSYVSNDRSGNRFHFSAYPSKHSNSTAVTNCFTAAAGSMVMDENRRPKKGSNNGIDKGSYYYYTNGMPSVVANLLSVDFKKGQRVYNNAIDIGPGEYDSRADLAMALSGADCFSIVDASAEVSAPSANSAAIPGGASLSGAWTLPEGDETVRGYSFTAAVTGNAVLYVYRDGAATAAWTVTAADGATTFGYAVAGGHSLRFVCEGDGSAIVSAFKSMLGRAWYVNADAGNDEYDGTQALPEGGDSLVGPKKTLAGAMAISGLAAGDVVHAAAGTYDDGEMAPVGGIGGITTNRVVVKAGVGLLADDGPDNTFIVGKKHVGGGVSGVGAIRCVYLNAESWLYGFTLTNGATETNGSYQDYGGGVCAASGACAANCFFTQNSARRGGAAYGGYYIACRFGLGNVANESSGLYDCQGVFNSYFDDCGVYGRWTLCNCTFRSSSPHGNGYQNVYNCFIDQESNKNCNYYNCILSGRNAGQCNPDDATRFDVADAGYDAATARPTSGSSLVDAGVCSYYDDNFPSAWAMFKSFDVSGGQRLYNGRLIDVGAGEFDWRVPFAKALHPYRASVVSASEGAADAGSGVALSEGESLVVDWTADGEGRSSVDIAVDGAGTLSATLDGEALELADSGPTMFSVSAGTHRLVFSFVGAGTATVGRFKNIVGTTVIMK